MSHPALTPDPGTADRGAPAALRRDDGEAPRVLDLLAVLLRRWKTVAATVLLAVAATLVLSLFRTPVYSARSVLVLRADESPGVDGLSSRLPSSGVFAGLAPSNANARLISAILKSRTLEDSVERRAGKAREVEIQDNLSDQRSITIRVMDPDPRRAARIANAFPGFINATAARITTEASQRREAFLDRQLATARRRLEQAEEGVASFQRGQNAPQIDEQARLTMQAAFELQTKIAEQEVAVARLRRTSTPDNPELRAAEAQLGALREQQRRLTSGEAAGRLAIPLRSAPALRVGATRVLRELTESEQVYGSLAGALAQTRIAANNTLPVVAVLDPAVVPDRPSGLPLAVLLAAAAVLGVVLGAALALGGEYLRGARTDRRNASFFDAWDELRGRRARSPRDAGTPAA